MHFRIKPFSKNVRSLYEKHGSFHKGDAGLDLFIIDKMTIKPGLSEIIKLQIACENIDIFSFDNSMIKGLSNFKGKQFNADAIG